jgi:glycosyltransferase involved in cell wall biosynthesis
MLHPVISTGYRGGCMRSISVFLPAFNDAPSIAGLVHKAFATLRRYAHTYEVIVINDGSTDRTAEVLADLQAQYSAQFRVITHPKNLGYGAALRTGFAAARMEWVFYTDGDGQYDPSEIEKLLEVVDGDTVLVNGFKTTRNDPWHRVAIGWLYNKFARTLFGIRIRDIDCDFRLIRRSELDCAKLRSTSGTICVEIVRMLELCGGNVAEVPVSHYPRLHGTSQFFRFRSLAVTLAQLVGLFFRLVLWPSIRRRSTRRFESRAEYALNSRR